MMRFCIGTVDSAFNVLGINKVSEFLNMFLENRFFFAKVLLIIKKGDKFLFFFGPLSFAE